MSRAIAVPEEFVVARTLRVILWVVLGGLCLGSISTSGFRTHCVLSIAAAGILASLICNHCGRPSWAVRIAICSVLFMASSLAFLASDGIRSINILMLAPLLVISALLEDHRWYLALAASTVGIVTAIGLHEMAMVAQGHKMVARVTTGATILQIDIIITVAAVAAGLLGSNLRASLKQTRQTVAQLDAANRELQDSERRFRSLVELAVDAIFITDDAGRVLVVNQRACCLTGYTKDKLLGMGIAEIFLCGQDGGGNPHTTETEVMCADGARVGVELNSKTMPDGVVQIFCRDITERRRSEEQIRQMQKMECIGRLAGGVAHDFNNLLTVIGGYSDMLLSDMDAGDRNLPPVREIHAAAEHAAGLTQQLLAFSRKQVAHPQPVEVAALVESSKKMLQRLLGEDIEVVVRRDPGALMTIADPAQLHQVLVNLAVNGRDAMPDGGQLTIATRTTRFDEKSFDSGGEIAPGEYISLSVTDTGSGMSEEIQRKIFEPFFTTKPAGKGTGLGLATVFGIVHQYKGRVDVRSAIGQGSTFMVYLPLFAGSAQTIKGLEIQPGQGTETVLVAEDQEAVRQLTSAILRASGYRVLEAATGEEALRLVQASGVRIDLILTDVVMPRMNGRELVGRLLALQPQAKVIYVSGYTNDILAPKNLTAEKVNLLAKPFRPDALTAMVRKVLDQPTPVC